MTTGMYATATMLNALMRLYRARTDVEYDDRRAGIVTDEMRAQLARLQGVR